MLLKRHDGPASFARSATPFLIKDEARHCLALGSLADVARSSDRHAAHSHFYTFEHDGIVAGAAWLVGTQSLGLTACSDEVLQALAVDLGRRGARPVAIAAPEREAEVFFGHWRSIVAVADSNRMPQRIFQISAVIDPAPIPGAMRTADVPDRALLIEWTAAFASEAKLHDDPRRTAESVDAALQGRRRVLWAIDGKPVAMASSAGKTPSGIRINAVYTPPELRRHGYASALVAALSRQLLAGGNRLCFLFTDRGNETSNSIYRKIGYEAVADVERIVLTYTK